MTKTGRPNPEESGQVAIVRRSQNRQPLEAYKNMLFLSKGE